MSKLLETINNDLKQSMKDRAVFELSVLRMLISAIKNKKISLGKDFEMKDSDVVDVIKSEIKKRKDSETTYRDAGRMDLAEKEEKEIKTLEKYMPEQMSEEEIEKMVLETISQLSASGVKDFGKVMGAMMGRIKGKADGDLVSGTVKRILNS